MLFMITMFEFRLLGKSPVARLFAASQHVLERRWFNTIQDPSYHTSWMPQAFLLFYRDLTFLEKPRVLGKC
jgi:hypothetical protein